MPIARCRVLFWPLLAAPLSVLMVVPAGAETTYQITTSNYIDAAHPACTVQVWAVFEPDLYAFAGAEFDLIATPGVQAGFSDPRRALTGPGASDGEPAPGSDSVSGILSGQIKQLPEEPHLDYGNPVLLWEATWSTTDFTPRTIDLRTYSRHFEVYVTDAFQAVSYMGPLSEGAGVIQIGDCFADCTGDGVSDLFDFLCFTNRFNAQDPGADCDMNGEFDLFDFLCFTNAFNAGC